MVFLMMNTWCSKHVEDTENWIKTLIWKRVHFVGLRYIFVSQCKVQKPKNNGCIKRNVWKIRSSERRMEESGGGRSAVFSAGTNSIIWEMLLGCTSLSTVSRSVRHGIPITIYLKVSSQVIKRFHVCLEESGTHTQTRTQKHIWV